MAHSSDLALSPTFERARSLSNVLRWFFVINFGVTALWLAAAAALLIWPQVASYSPDGSLASVAGLPMPGVFVVNDRLPVRQAIDELLLGALCSEQAEWAGLVLYLPL